MRRFANHFAPKFFAATPLRTMNNGQQSSNSGENQTSISLYDFTEQDSGSSDFSKAAAGFFQSSPRERPGFHHIDFPAGLRYPTSGIYVAPDLKAMTVLCHRNKDDGACNFMDAVTEQVLDVSVRYNRHPKMRDYTLIQISGLYDTYPRIADIVAQIKAQDPHVFNNPGLLEDKDYCTNQNNYPSSLLPLYQKYYFLQMNRVSRMNRHAAVHCLESFVSNVDVNLESFFDNFVSPVRQRAQEIYRQQPELVVPNIPRSQNSFKPGSR
jgi:hypothetical protein